MSANITRRTFHPKVKILDERNGLVEYIASDESVDSDREIVRAAGWRFDNFQKNSPFVDSHNYTSIEFKLGEVVDYKVEGNRLIETVQWLTDVPEHRLATIGWKLTVAGMPPACSVGFMPVNAVERSDGRSAWRDACQQVNQNPNTTTATRICLEQQQRELSAVILGANPNAVARAQKAGILTETEIKTFWPHHEREMHVTRRTYSFGSATYPTTTKTAPTTSMSKEAFAEKLNTLTSQSRKQLEQVESARCDASETELLRTLRNYENRRMAEKKHRALAYLATLRADEQIAAALDGAVKTVCKLGLNSDERNALQIVTKAMGESNEPGLSLGATQLVSQVILDLVPLYGVAMATLGVRPMPSGSARFVRVTGLPTAQWFTQGQQPITLTPDAGLAGASVSDSANTVGILEEVAAELIEDAKSNDGIAGTDITTLVTTRAAQGLSAGLDIAAINGNGTADATNGGQYGIFQAQNIPEVNAANGNTTIASLQREDFMAVASAVNPTALQRGCRSWTYAGFLPSLMQIKAGTAGYLVKSPIENGTDEWSLCGFPLSLTTAAPNATDPGSAVIAFGHGPAYNVGIRQELEFGYGRPKFDKNIQSIRILMRARCEVNEPTWFAILNTAAK